MKAGNSSLGAWVEAEVVSDKVGYDGDPSHPFGTEKNMVFARRKRAKSEIYHPVSKFLSQKVVNIFDAYPHGDKTLKPYKAFVAPSNFEIQLFKTGSVNVKAGDIVVATDDTIKSFSRREFFKEFVYPEKRSFKQHWKDFIFRIKTCDDDSNQR